jgi:pilus assembly protein Flp/PilA
MLNLIIRFRSLLRDAKGQDLIEYALLAGIIALGSVAVMGDVSASINGVWESIQGSLDGAIE